MVMVSPLHMFAETDQHEYLKSPIPGLVTLPRGVEEAMEMDSEPPAQSDVLQLERRPEESNTPASDPFVINQLSKTLMDIRTEVAGHIIKERAILQALTNFDASAALNELADPALDLPSSENAFSKNQLGFLTRGSLGLNSRILVSKIRLLLLKNDLENVRLKRLMAEQSVQEIAREGRAPFVCPALMDAFIGVSRLSAQALGTESN